MYFNFVLARKWDENKKQYKYWVLVDGKKVKGSETYDEKIAHNKYHRIMRKTNPTNF